MIRTCERCGGLYATENGEMYAGTPCKCGVPKGGEWYCETKDCPTGSGKLQSDPLGPLILELAKCCSPDNGPELNALRMLDFLKCHSPDAENRKRQPMSHGESSNATAAPSSANYGLFKYMSDTYELTLLESELHDLEDEVVRVIIARDMKQLLWHICEKLSQECTTEAQQMERAEACLKLWLQTCGINYSPNGEVSASGGR